MEIIKDENNMRNNKIKCECGREEILNAYYAAHCMVHIDYTCLISVTKDLFESCRDMRDYIVTLWQNDIIPLQLRHSCKYLIDKADAALTKAKNE